MFLLASDILTLDSDSRSVYKCCHEQHKQPNLFDRRACLADGITAPDSSVLHPAGPCRSTYRREKGGSLHRHASRSAPNHPQMAERWTVPRSNKGNFGRAAVRHAPTSEAARERYRRSLEPFGGVRWIGNNPRTRTRWYDSRASQSIFQGRNSFASGNHTTRQQG